MRRWLLSNSLVVVRIGSRWRSVRVGIVNGLVDLGTGEGAATAPHRRGTLLMRGCQGESADEEACEEDEGADHGIAQGVQQVQGCGEEAGSGRVRIRVQRESMESMRH